MLRTNCITPLFPCQEYFSLANKHFTIRDIDRHQSGEEIDMRDSDRVNIPVAAFSYHSFLHSERLVEHQRALANGCHTPYTLDVRVRDGVMLPPVVYLHRRECLLLDVDVLKCDGCHLVFTPVRLNFTRFCEHVGHSTRFFLPNLSYTGTQPDRSPFSTTRMVEHCRQYLWSRTIMVYLLLVKLVWLAGT